MLGLASPIDILRPPSIEFGSGTVAAVGRWAAAKALRRVLMVFDAFNADRVAALGLPGEAVVFGELEPEPDTPNLEKALPPPKPDLVVGYCSGKSTHDVVGPEKVHGREERLGVEMRLSRLGVPESDLPAMADEAHAIHRPLDNDQRDIGRNEILAMHCAAY